VCVELAFHDELHECEYIELRVELSIGKIARAFAVDALEMSTIRATMEIRTPTVSRVVVNANNILLLGASLNRHDECNYAV
jgi:hypothetical protein